MKSSIDVVVSVVWVLVTKHQSAAGHLASSKEPTKGIKIDLPIVYEGTQYNLSKGLAI